MNGSVGIYLNLKPQNESFWIFHYEVVLYVA